MKRQLLITLILAFAVASCGTYKSGTLFGSGFYGKNKVIETDHPEREVIEPEADFVESPEPENNSYETIETEPENTFSPETFTYSETPQEAGFESGQLNDFDSFENVERETLPDYEKSKKFETKYKNIPPDESDDKAVRIILLVLLGFILLVFLFGLTFLIIFLVLIL